MNSPQKFFTPLPESGTEEGEQIRAAQMSAFNSQIQLPLFASVFALVIITSVFIGTAPLWLLAGGAILIATAAYSRIFRSVLKKILNIAGSGKYLDTASLVTCLVWVNGFIWGLWLLLLFGYASGPQKYFLGIFAVGNAVSALCGMVAIPRAAAGFAALNLVPLSVVYFMSGDKLLTATAAMGILFILVMVISIRRQYNNFIRGLTSEFSHSRQLSRLRNQYEDFIKTSSDWVWETDLNHKFTFCSDRREELTGVPVERLLDSKRSDILDEEDLTSEWREHFATLEAHRPFTDFIYPYTHPSGREMWFSISGNPNFDATGKFLGYRGCGTDVSSQLKAQAKRKLAEAELRDANRHLEARVKERTGQLEAREREINSLYENILETTSDWVWELGPDLRFTKFSERFTELSGIELTDILGKTRRDMMEKAEVTPDMEAHLELLEAHLPFRDFTYMSKRSDGSDLWMSITGIPHFDEGGQFTGYRGSGADITEKIVAEDKRREAEKALRKVNQQLEKRVRERTAKLKAREEELRTARDQALDASQAKSQFLATMSHEIRTPMNGVLGMTELLIETGLSQRQQRFAEIILRSGRSLMEIINDILDLSKIESGKLDLEIIPFDLIDTLNDVSELFGANARGKGITMELEIEPGIDGTVDGDPIRIRQILMNLLSNAVKFTDRGGVTLRARLAENKLIRFEVSDTGIGIPGKALEQIFEMFTQAEQSTTRRFGGTGLGLSISRQLATMMGGELGVESVESEGSTFWFTALLPAASAEIAAEKVSVPPPPPPAKDQKLPYTDPLVILVAEDNPVNQMVATESLAQLGIQADVVANGHEAVEAARNRAYGLILMDMEMPELDGCGAARKIRLEQKSKNNPKDVTIIAMTADNGAEARKRCKRAGMDGYLSKPFSLEDLKDTIDRWAP